MKSIYAAKLFVASTRKDAIMSVMNDPNSQGLMVQLAKYLDDEYRTPENLGLHPEQPEEPSKSEESNESIRDNVGDFKREPSSGSHPGRISGLPEGMDLVDVPESEDDLPTEEDFSSAPEGGEDQEPTESATELEPIQACEVPSIDTIKSTLNSVAETAGVQRITSKENELWIYYDDSINLNSLMTDVIEYLAKAGYSNLEFNRLARSDNAMVFEVLDSSTPVEVHYEQE